MTTYKAKVCRGCGLDFRPEVRGQAYCYVCRHVRADAVAAQLAARPFITCRKCGEQKQDCSRWGTCAECRAKQREERRHKYEEHQREQALHQGQDLRRQLRHSFKRAMTGLSPDEQLTMVLGLLRWVMDHTEGAEEVNPEEIPASDQDAIDDAFASIMEGFDL